MIAGSFCFNHDFESYYEIGNADPVKKQCHWCGVHRRMG